MSLATRCPACGTVFRLVPDQLKVSDGWVRCGRCTEVFNASQRLFELEAQALGAPPGPTAPPPTAAPAPPTPTPPAPVAAPAPPSPQPLQAQPDPQNEGAATPPAADEAVPAAPAMPMAAATGVPQALPAEADATPSPAAEWQPPPEPAAPGTPAAEPTLVPPAELAPEAAPALPPAPEPEPEPEPEAEPKPEPAAMPAVRAPAEPVAEPALMPVPGEVATEPVPGFMRRAEQAARWQQPRRVALLAGVSLLLALLLAAQIALHYRDHLAASVPAARTALTQACNWLGCTIEPPRRIDSLHVDSSGLVRVPDSAFYRLTLVVQNKAAIEVRMPAVELVLSDAQGQTAVRRVFTAAELGQPAPSLPPRGEASLQALLDLGERRMAGYTVELFYP